MSIYLLLFLSYLSLINTTSTFTSTPLSTSYVSSVIDGDTIILQDHSNILYEAKKYKCRLLYIDTPELKQSYGMRSKNYLKNLILYKYIEVQIYNTDRYNRKLCVIYYNNMNVNQELVKLGYAFVYERYIKDEYLKYQYLKLQNYAQDNKLGVWSQNYIEKPWDYRKKRKGW